jgi:dimethylamine monooxygenase subunit A
VAKTLTPHPPPAFYFPPRDGRYEVAAGLVRFGKDFGNGPRDAQVFQIDSDFGDYRRQKLAARREGLGRYFCTDQLADDVSAAATAFIATRLATEHPAWFRLSSPDGAGRVTLTCGLTGDALTFDRGMRLVMCETANAPNPPYASALDALACQGQEDLAVLSGRKGRHWLSAAHVCFPNGWSPREKVGRDFAGLHEPVAGMAALNRRGDEFARIMFGATGGMLRFAWGITFDDRLNHRPDLPLTPFDPVRPRALLRVERQTSWGLPGVTASLFTIRTYLYDCAALCADTATRGQLVSAIASMPPQSLTYKNLSDVRERLSKWLSGM